MTATEVAFQMNNDPVYQAKFRLAELMAKEIKAREAARELARVQKLIDRMERRQAMAGA